MQGVYLARVFHPHTHDPFPRLFSSCTSRCRRSYEMSWPGCLQKTVANSAKYASPLPTASSVQCFPYVRVFPSRSTCSPFLGIRSTPSKKLKSSVWITPHASTPRDVLSFCDATETPNAATT